MGSTNHTQTVSQDDINKGIGEAFQADYSEALIKCAGNGDAAYRMAMNKQEERRKAAKGGKKFSIRWGRK